MRRHAPHASVGLVVLGIALGWFASSGHGFDPLATAGDPAVAPVASKHEPVPIRSFPAFKAEKLTLDQITERYRVLVEESNQVTSEAKALRKLPADSDLRWDPSPKDGAWLLYALPPETAPVPSK